MFGGNLVPFGVLIGVLRASHLREVFFMKNIFMKKLKKEN